MSKNKMVVLNMLYTRDTDDTDYGYSPSGYALAVAVSNVVRKFKEDSVQREVKRLLREGVELTYTIVEGSSLPYAVSDNLWETLNSLRVTSDDDLSAYSLELNDDEGGVVFKVDQLFVDTQGLLEGVTNFKTASKLLDLKTSTDFAKEQVEFIETTKSNVKTLEELELALNTEIVSSSLTKITADMEDLLSSRKGNSEFRQSWDNLRKQLIEGNSRNFIGDVPSHLLVEVTNPFEVYVDYTDSIQETDARAILEGQLQGYLPYQYDVDGSMCLNLQGGVLREPVYKYFKDKGVVYDRAYIEGKKKDSKLSTHLTYGEAVLLYMIAKGGSVALPLTEVDGIFKAILNVGLQSQKDFLGSWFNSSTKSLEESYKESKQVSLDSYVAFCRENLDFEKYFGFLYVLYSDNLFNCIEEGLPDFHGMISRVDFSHLMSSLG